MTRRATILLPTKHVFGGPYVEALLSVVARTYPDINILHASAEQNEELIALARSVGATNVTTSYISYARRGFRESLLITLPLFLVLMLRRFEKGSDYFAVGIRAGLLGLLLFALFRVRPTYYCLEIYTRTNTGLLWPVVRHVQRWVCRLSPSVIIQGAARSRALDSALGGTVKTLFQANAPRAPYTSLPQKSSAQPQLIYSGATKAIWAGPRFVDLLTNLVGKNKIHIDDRFAKSHLAPADYYAILATYSAGVAFYESTNDINVSVIGFSSGKINSYLYCGLAIIINDVAPYSELARTFDCGLVIDARTSSGTLHEFLGRVRDDRTGFHSRSRACFDYIVSMDTFK